VLAVLAVVAVLLILVAAMRRARVADSGGPAAG
jgi:hypothetical protein